MSIRPEDFSSDHPPVRPMGTECEYNQQLIPGGVVTSAHFLNNETLRNCGIRIQNGYVGEKYGAGKVYPDVGHLEFNSRESMGPASAAVEDLNGIEHLSNIVNASGYLHKGIYRLSGTYIPNGLIEGGGRDSRGRTSGYHESYLFPRHLEYSDAFTHLLPSASAFQVWSRGGTLRHEGFVFAQKVWGNGGDPVEHSLQRRTSHGNRPMITVPPITSDSDTLGDPLWARAEVRMPDPGLSLVNRFLGFANMSLTLRLIEQADRLELTRERLANICLADPVAAAKAYAGDLTLQVTAETIDGRRFNALNGQESMLDLFESLQAHVPLPEDEKIAIAGIRSVVDALRTSQPAQAEYSGMAKLRVEFAAKHQFISQDRPQADIKAASKVAMQRNIEWSRVLPVGPGLRYWQRVASRDPLAAKVHELAATAGASKRSTRRARIVDDPDGKNRVVNWSYYDDEGGARRSLGSPAGD